MSTTGTEPKAKSTNYLGAIHDAMVEEMERDESVILMGEDVVASVFGTSTGMQDEFGPARVRDTPLSEAGFVGAAVGAAMTGIRPIVDMTMASFVYVAMDQLVSQAAKNRYMFGGQANIPVVFRAGLFYDGPMAAHHSDRPYALFMGIPGMKIVTPTSPYDVKGLLKTAIRDENPVLFFEDQQMWTSREQIPTDEYLIPFGEAAVKREGTDVTVVAITGTVARAMKAAEALEDEGISVEVIDPRTLVPFDWRTVLSSVEKTKRLVAVDPAHRLCSVASEITATVAEELFGVLLAPPVRVVTPDTHVPFSPEMMKGMFPDEAKITEAVRKVVA